MAPGLNFRRRPMHRSATFSAAFVFVILGLAGTIPLRAQSQPDSATTALAYEVASIKLNKSGTNMVRIMGSADALTATNVPLKELVRMAYQVQDFQISGGPGWMSSDHYDIEAKMDKATADELQKLPPEERGRMQERMMQALLVDRFQLKLHRESKEFPEYALVVAKNGSKLHEAVPGDTYPNGIKGPDGVAHAGMMMMGRGQLTAQALPISSLVRMLSSQLSRTVVDKTGLTGKYDMSLHWAPDDGELPGLKGPPGGPPSTQPAANADSGPSIFTAIQEQLGLKLDSQKGPVEILVIDHVEKPSEN